MVKISKNYHPSKFARFVVYPIGFLLFSLILVFVITLANGYRFDFKNNKIILEKTGIILLTTRPNDASIYINNKFSGQKSSFSFLTTRLSDFLPGKYMITIKKDGYRDWKKETQVKPNLVTWLNYILLFPNDLKIVRNDDLIDKNVITQSKNKKLLFLSDKNSPTSTFYTYDQAGNMTKIWPRAYIPTEEWLKQPDIISADFSAVGDKLLLKVKNGDKTDYAVLDVALDGKITTLSTYNLNFAKIVWNPNNSNQIFALADGTLYRLDLTNTAPQELAKNIIDFTAEKNGQIYFVAFDGTLTTINQMAFDGGEKRVISKAVTKNTGYRMSYSSQLDALAVMPIEDKTLTVYYKLNNQVSTVELAKNIRDFSWSQGGRRIQYYTDASVTRFDWDKQEEIVNKIDGVKKADWYFDENHFLVLTNRNLFEMDYDGENKVEFSNMKVVDFYLDPRLSSMMFYENKDGKLDFYKYSSQISF